MLPSLSLATLLLSTTVTAPPTQAAHAPSSKGIRIADPPPGLLESIPIDDAVLFSVAQVRSVTLGTFSLTLPLGPDATPRVVHFEPHSVRSPGYRVVEDRGPDGFVDIDPGPVRTISGTLPGNPDAVIRGAMLDDGLHLVCRWPDGEIQWIEPVSRYVADADRTVHALYDNDAIPPSVFRCGTPDVPYAPDVPAAERLNAPLATIPSMTYATTVGMGPQASSGPPSPTSEPHERRGAATGEGLGTGLLYCAKIACDADHRFYEDYGSDTTAVQDRIELITATSNSQFESQIGLRHTLTQILVRTDPTTDPYAAIDNLIDMNRDGACDWKTNRPEVEKDGLQIFTAMRPQPPFNAIGYANLAICDDSQACDPSASSYGLFGTCSVISDCCSTLGCATDLSTHELAHLWGSNHNNCFPSTMYGDGITCANSFCRYARDEFSRNISQFPCREICGELEPGAYCAAAGAGADTGYIWRIDLATTTWNGPLTWGLGNPMHADVSAGHWGFYNKLVLFHVYPDQLDSVGLTMHNIDSNRSEDLFAAWIDWNQDGDFDDENESITEIPGGGEYQFTITPPDGITRSAWYRLRARIVDTTVDSMSPCGILESGSVVDLTVVYDPEGYCYTRVLNAEYEHIASVDIPDAGISRTSGQDIYAHYPEDVGTVAPGETYTANIVSGYPYEGDEIAIYADWNGDRDFEDPGERLDVADGGGPYTLDIRVPDDQPDGRVRMRIRLHDRDAFGSEVRPCLALEFGETEDYELEVLDPCPADFNNDGRTDSADIGPILAAWGPCTGTLCPFDVNHDGIVNAADLGLLVASWGPCP